VGHKISYSTKWRGNPSPQLKKLLKKPQNNKNCDNITLVCG